MDHETYFDLPPTFQIDDLQFIRRTQLLKDLLANELFTENKRIQLMDAVNFLESRASHFQVLSSEEKLEATDLTELLANMKIRKENGLEDFSCNNEGRVPAATDLFQIDMVVKCLFRFLPFKDIKSCRIVCRKWNSVAESILRKRGKFIFTSSFYPEDFIDTYAVLPEVSFTAFKFGVKKSCDELPYEDTSVDNVYYTTELTDFFSQWGVYIKHLHFWSVKLKNDNHKKIAEYDISNYFFQLPNLAELKIEYCNDKSCIDTHTRLSVQWDKLQSVDMISLSGCHVNMSEAKTVIAPRKIHLCDVSFSLNGNSVIVNNLNDFIDFSKVTEICILGSTSFHGKFDWEKIDVVQAQRITFGGITIENWIEAKGKTDVLTLINTDFTLQTKMQIMELIFVSNDASKIDFSVLPDTIEKLTVVAKIMQVGWRPTLTASGSIYLPNLTFLKVEVESDIKIKFLSRFANCSNLVDLILLFPMKYKYTLDVDWIPKSVKKLKIVAYKFENLEFVGDDFQQIDLDLLILCGSCSFYEKPVLKIQPKLLVMLPVCECIKHSTKMEELLSFICENKQLEKIVVCVTGVNFGNGSFYTSVLSKYVDKKSEYYEFVNQ